MPDMTHECLPGLCKRRVPAHMLFCRNHWYRVPVMLRQAVWAAWDNGRGAGTSEHMLAISDAIEAVRARHA